MRSQIVTASPANAVADTSKRNIRHLPYAFTEHGALMAANILNSPRAVAISVYVIRAFARLRSFYILHSAFCIPPMGARARRQHPGEDREGVRTFQHTEKRGRSDVWMCGTCSSDLPLQRSRGVVGG